MPYYDIERTRHLIKIKYHGFVNFNIRENGIIAYVFLKEKLNKADDYLSITNFFVKKNSILIIKL